MCLTPEQRKARIEELKSQIEPLQEELNRIVRGCGVDTPHRIVRKGSKHFPSAYCDICATYHGHWCPDSEDGICDYWHPWKPEVGEEVQLKEPRMSLGHSKPVKRFVVAEILEDGRFMAQGYLFSATLEELEEGQDSYDDDCCRYCGHPEERK